MATILKIIAIILLLWLEIMKVSLAKETHDEKAEVIILCVSHSAQLFVSPFSQPLTFSIILEMKYKCLTMTSIHCGEIFSRYDQLSGLRFPFLTYTLKASYF